MLKLRRRNWRRKNGLGTTKCWWLVNGLPNCRLTKLATHCNGSRGSRRCFQERTAIHHRFSAFRLDHGSLLEVPLMGQHNALPTAECAILSMSLMSCSSAGSRGAAVWMLVLSIPGMPVAWVMDGVRSVMRVSVC